MSEINFTALKSENQKGYRNFPQKEISVSSFVCSNYAFLFTA